MDKPFIPGQPVVWLYRPTYHRRPLYLVDAEVVQTGELRIRIRIITASGSTLLRWVHPKNLRSKLPDEPAYPYPGQ